MKKKSLGATLLRALDELRQSNHSRAVHAAGSERPSVNLDSNSQALVSAMFNSARRRIAEIINMEEGWAHCHVILGTVGPRTGMPLDSEAIRILSDACWPMTIAEGIQLSTNPFHYEWIALKRWATEEELTVEIRAEFGKVIAKTDFQVVSSRGRNHSLLHLPRSYSDLGIFLPHVWRQRYTCTAPMRRVVSGK